MTSSELTKKELVIQITAFHIRKEYLNCYPFDDFEWLCKSLTKNTESDIMDSINEYRKNLESCNLNDLKRRYDEEEAILYHLHDKYARNDKFADILSNKTDADYIYWNKMATWTLEQAITLLLGKDPRMVTWDAIQNHNCYFVKEYTELRYLIMNANQAGDLHDPTRPQKFIEYCLNKGIEVPDELQELVGEKSLPSYLNKQHPHYSPKLDIAIKTHQAISQDPIALKNKTPKKAAAEYITKNAKSFGLIKNDKVNKQAIEEIAKNVNWQNKGGAPRTS